MFHKWFSVAVVVLGIVSMAPAAEAKTPRESSKIELVRQNHKRSLAALKKAHQDRVRAARQEGMLFTHAVQREAHDVPEMLAANDS